LAQGMDYRPSLTGHPTAVREADPTGEVERLRAREKIAIAYVRSKVDQLLTVLGTLPLRPEELDDESLVALDPIGIIAESFGQILEHLKETNEDRAEAHRELQAIFDSAGAAVMVVDSTRRVLACNRRARELFLQDRTGTVEFSLPEPFCDPSGPSDECVFEGIIRTGSAQEREDFVYGQRHFHVVGTPLKDKAGGVSRVVLVYTDITASKQAEDALRESEERYRSLYSNMREGVALHELVRDEAGRPVDYVILDVNPSYERITGIPRVQAVGTLASVLYGTGEPPYLETYAQVAESGHAVSFEAAFEPMQRVFSISATSPAPGRFATIFDDITERKRVEQEIQSLAYLDTLTGLPNRTLLQDRLREALIRAERESSLVAVLFLDLDRFKPINDTLGHSLGDLLLKSVAGRLKACVRRSDTVARLGGDEFVVLLPGIQRELDTTLAAREILERLAQPFDLGGREIYSSGSIGIAVYPLDGRDPGTLLKNADMAMYVAKDRGRNTYQFYSGEMNRRALERLDLETSLRRALKHQELSLQYQPQVDLVQGRVTGVEALVRWCHPEQGLIPPGRFVPVAEETGLILPVGEWVLRAACLQGRPWQDAGLPDLRMAVNLSGRQFKQPGFVNLVGDILAETGMPPERLELELTESMIMEDAEEMVKRLGALKSMGLRLAIDDFGTGYSSLSYLKNFPIDRIKIAQTFVRDIATDPGDAVIVETVLAMAASLRLEVIAEGVETEEQYAFLRSRHCHAMQGYYFAIPLWPRDVEPLLRRGALPLGERGTA
jgi:diguanylate cyclase (GGDEF)-like protein/PAS domain S-box-containing protein